jgi:hypothetical protein
LAINIEREHFVEPYSYGIFYDPGDGLYKAKNGLTSDIDYNNADAAIVFQGAVVALGATGGIIRFKNGTYVGNSTITIPNGTHCLSFIGESGLGKSFAGIAAYHGTHFKWTVTPMFTNDYTNNLRSIFGITFENIKFEGPDTDPSIGLDMKNCDQLIVDYCHFYRLGYGIKSVFTDGTATYTLAEQPGTVRVANTTFSEMRINDIYLERCTDCFIGPNVFFEAFGSVARRVHLKGCNAIEIHNDKFQTDGGGVLTEQVYIETINATYKGTEIELKGNWVWLNNVAGCWIRTAGANDIYDVSSVGNHIHHGYAANELTDPGYIILASETLHQIMAHDQVDIVCNPIANIKDHTIGGADPWADNVTRQNKWSPMQVQLTESIDQGDKVEVQMHETSAGLFSVQSAEGHSATNKNVPITFIVPTLCYWKIVPTGTPVQIGLIVTYLS